MKKAYLNWSGGKDAALSLHRLLAESQYEVCSLLTTVSADYQRVSMHGVREVLLREQACQIGLPLKVVYLPESTGMAAYDELMGNCISEFAAEDIRHAVFGDIFLEDLRDYRERQLGLAGMKGVFPLWKSDTRALLLEFLDAGFKAIITCVNADLLDRSFAGRTLDRDFIQDLPSGVDPCGERGEFHSFVYDGPLFKKPVAFSRGEVVEKSYQSSKEENVQWATRYYFCDLLP